MRSLTNELEPGDKVSISGWIHEIRDLGGIIFLILRDREGVVQVKLKEEEVSDELFSLGDDISRESVIEVSGEVEEEDRAPTGIEVVPTDIEVLNEAETQLPLDPTGKVDSEITTRLDNRTLDLRKPEIQAIFNIRAEVLDSLRNTFIENDCTEINTPKIVATATEGGTDLFPISYFEREAFLNQSPQLFKQMMVGSNLERVFEIGPIFRAEEHNTPRHLNEATSIDFESAFIDDEEAMQFCQEVVVNTYRDIKQNCSDDLEELDLELKIPETPFEYIQYEEALEMVNAHGDLDHELVWGDDLSTEAEHALGEQIGGHYFVTAWPSEVKPFYIQDREENPEVSKAFDLMHPTMELMSGGQREHRYEPLRDAIREQGLEPEEFDYYLDAFRYGMPPHAGWGLGLERLLVTMLDIDNVREVVLFPRDRQRLSP